MRVAIVHYWLVNMRGGEKVLAELCKLYPDADIFTHVYKPSVIPGIISNHQVLTSFINFLPFSNRLYKYYLPLMPVALKFFNLKKYDLIISSESGPAKGVSKRNGAKHICYCHTPMRYLWDMYNEYRSHSGLFVRVVMSLLVPWLRIWDVRAADGVDYFVSNSQYVRERVRRVYSRDSSVIYPPVSVSNFYISENVEDYYLYVGELTAYKRPQLAIEAFNKSGRRLVVVGDGELMHELRGCASDNIVFRGRLTDDMLRDVYSRCRALIFPGTEDFGIVPLEAMASGRPVIAYAEGGALETVVQGKTGLLFHDCSLDSLNAAIDRYEVIENKFSPQLIRTHAQNFSGDRFRREWAELLEQVGVI